MQKGEHWWTSYWQPLSTHSPHCSPWHCQGEPSLWMPGTCGHEGAAISLPTVWDQPEGPKRTFTALPSGDPTAAGTGMYVEGAVHQLPWITATIANKSPKFHLPPGLTPAPREVPHSSSHSWVSHPAWHLLQIRVYVTSCAHAVQVKPTHVCQGTSPPALGLAPFN